MQFLREITEKGPVVHAEDVAEGDRTLCGYAEEGSAMAGEGDSGWHRVNSGKINCQTCLRIIRYCKTIPAARMATGRSA